VQQRGSSGRRFSLLVAVVMGAQAASWEPSGADEQRSCEPSPIDLGNTDTTTTAELDRQSRAWRHAKAAELVARGLELATSGQSRGAWHYQRALSLHRGYVARESRCGSRHLHLRSAGVEWTMPQPCNGRACKRCDGAQLRRRVARLRDALQQHDRQERRRGRRLRLLTLTERHQMGVDLAEQHDRMQLAWRRLLANVCKRTPKVRFAVVVEVNHGNNGWHLHMHALMWLPAWYDYGQLHRWWQSGLGGDASGKGADAVGNVDVQEVTLNRGAADYLSKGSGWLAEYASKASSLSHLAPELRAQALGVLYGRRLVRASWRFWIARRSMHGAQLVRVVTLAAPSPWAIGVTKRVRRSSRDGPPT